jgi:hypothetical protein
VLRHRRAVILPTNPAATRLARQILDLQWLLRGGRALSRACCCGAEYIFGHQAVFIGGSLVIESGNTLADRRILGSSFERVIGQMAGEPHFARSCELTRTAQQDPGPASEGGDLAGQRAPAARASARSAARSTSRRSSG